MVFIWFNNFLFLLSLDIFQGLIILICLPCVVQIKHLIASKLITLKLTQFSVNPQTLHSSLPKKECGMRDPPPFPRYEFYNATIFWFDLVGKFPISNFLWADNASRLTFGFWKYHYLYRNTERPPPTNLIHYISAAVHVQKWNLPKICLFCNPEV